MNLFEDINQKDLNALIYALLHHFSLKVSSDFINPTSEYIDLTFDLKDNQDAGSEYIVTSDVAVNVNKVKFNSSSYYLKLYYYDLGDGDIDNTHDYDVLKEKIVKLTPGENIIRFDEDLVYLQYDFDLIIGE